MSHSTAVVTANLRPVEYQLIDVVAVQKIGNPVTLLPGTRATIYLLDNQALMVRQVPA